METTNQWTLTQAAHLLNRAGFGGTPKEIHTLHGMGREKALAYLMDAEDKPGSFPAPAWSGAEGRREMLAQTRGGAEKRAAMAGMDEAAREKMRKQIRREAVMDQRGQVDELRKWWLTRMCQTQAPLREKMAFFWHDHFACSVQKVRLSWLMYDQNELFRQHALGTFKTLTKAIAKDPAMMIFLDTIGSRSTKPNENFARELMELFTLGEGHYSEADIKQAALAFTGFQLDKASGKVSQNRGQANTAEITVLGETGKFDANGIVEVIFRQPRCAVFLTEKLWDYFAATPPPAGLIDKLAAILRAGDYEVAPLLRAIFSSAEFNAAEVVRTRIKSPVEYLVQMLRQLELAAPPERYLETALREMGQVPFLPPNVAGWDWGRGWINTNTLLSRYSVAGVISTGGDSGRNSERKMRAGKAAGPDFAKIAPAALRESPAKLVAELCFRFFQTEVPSKEREAFEAYAKVKLGASFTDGELAELVHLMMSTPHYQLS
jgi:uncharacterized protein (DUF1800 family)